jgi:hypothetical protein
MRGLLIAGLVLVAVGSGCGGGSKNATTTATVPPTTTVPVTTAGSSPRHPDVERLAAFVAWCGKV